MDWRQRMRIVTALVLLVALASPASAAQAAKGPSAFDRVWTWLAAVLPWEPPAGASLDQCSMIDPDGQCRAGLSAVRADQCIMIDPNGQCHDGLTVVRADQCSMIDPNGQCHDNK